MLATQDAFSVLRKICQVLAVEHLANIDSRALGGAIGTGLFIGSGAILSLVGPAPLFMGYISNMGTILRFPVRCGGRTDCFNMVLTVRQAEDDGKP